jgi:SAM-dependent methyltransferase
LGFRGRTGPAEFFVKILTKDFSGGILAWYNNLVEVFPVKNSQLDYGNWVPKKMLYLQGLMIIILISLTVFIQIFPLKIVFCIIAVMFLFFFAYFFKSYCAFSYNGGKVSEKILDMVISYIKWDEKCDILDIGCGSGALSIKMAKKFSDAKITGIDYWGKGWDYKQKQCRQNASLEGVSEKITFLEASASKLPFENESFDIVTSNFVFHEVKDTKNKIDVIKEALRTVKRGGVFVFHDLFYVKSIYGDPDKMIAELRVSGISEINMTNTSEMEIIPKFLRTSFMLGGIGIIYGKK